MIEEKELIEWVSNKCTTEIKSIDDINLKNRWGLVCEEYPDIDIDFIENYYKYINFYNLSQNWRVLNNPKNKDILYFYKYKLFWSKIGIYKKLNDEEFDKYDKFIDYNTVLKTQKVKKDIIIYLFNKYSFIDYHSLVLENLPKYQFLDLDTWEYILSNYNHSFIKTDRFNKLICRYQDPNVILNLRKFINLDKYINDFKKNILLKDKIFIQPDNLNKDITLPENKYLPWRLNLTFYEECINYYLYTVDLFLINKEDLDTPILCNNFNPKIINKVNILKTR